MAVEVGQSLVSSLSRSWQLADRFLRIALFVECRRPLMRYMLLNFILVKLCTYMVYGIPKTTPYVKFISHFWPTLGVGLSLVLLAILLRSFIRKHVKQWVSLLVQAEFAYNNTARKMPIWSCILHHYPLGVNLVEMLKKKLGQSRSYMRKWVGEFWSKPTKIPVKRTNIEKPAVFGEGDLV